MNEKDTDALFFLSQGGCRDKAQLSSFSVLTRIMEIYIRAEKPALFLRYLQENEAAIEEIVKEKSQDQMMDCECKDDVIKNVERLYQKVMDQYFLHIVTKKST